MRDVSTTGGYVPLSILKHGDKEKNMYLIFQYSYERDFMIIYPGFLVIMFLKEEGYILEGELV